MTSERGFDDIRASGGFRSVGTTGSDPATEIEQTRAELSETIGAIQERLAPQGLAAEATDVVADATDRSVAMAREIVEQTIQEATKQAKVAIVEISAQAQVSAREVAREITEQAKVSARGMADQAKASVRGATIGRVERMATSTSEMAKQAATSGSEKAKQAASSGSETAKGFGSTLVTTVKQNPWPAALTALGIGWLVSSGGGAKSGGTPQSKAQAATPPEYGTSTDGGTGTSTVDRAMETTGQAVGQVASATGQAVDKAQDAVGTAASTVAETGGEVLGTVTGTVGGAVSTVGSALGSTASKVKTGVTGLVTGVEQRVQQVSGMATESPMKVGAATLAVGGVVGLALPVSQRETALIGEARDKAVDRAEKAVQETLTKLQSVAQEAQEAAAKEAKYQGLAPDAS